MRRHKQRQSGVSHGSGRTRSRRDLSCHLCERVFHKNEHLNRHIISHTKEKPFRCQVCPKSYGRYDSLLRHARKHADSSEVSVQVSEQLEQSQSTGASLAVTSPSEGRSRRQHTAVHVVGNKGRPSHASPSYAPSSLPPANGFCIDGNGFINVEAVPSPTLRQSQQRSLGFDYGSVQSVPDDSCDNTPYHQAGHHQDLFSVSEEVGSMPNLNHWNPNSTTVQESSWFLGGEFDFIALNNSITANLPNWTFQTPAFIPDHNGPIEQSQEATQKSPVMTHSDTRSVVEELWITRPAATTSDSHYSHTSINNDQLDENYINHLHGRLNPSLRDGCLPPASFLNLCIKLFFTKFNPVFPLIHAPTFRPSSDNALLVISICSIGALFVGTASAASQGREIFLRLNKAILASWETYVYKRGPESLSIAQAVVLGQTFGMLSGKSNDLLLTHSFHGTIISWARQAGMFEVQASENAISDYKASDDDIMWKAWVRAEETVRVLAGLYIHDCEFTTIFHTDPFLRNGNVESLPNCCSNELFAANSTNEWRTVLSHGTRTSQQQPHDSSSETEALYDEALPVSNSYCCFSHLNSYVFLSSIIASLSETRRSSAYTSQLAGFSHQLQSWWRTSRVRSRQDTVEEPNSSLEVLWHEAFIVLYTDVDFLERRVGRDGTTSATTIIARTNCGISEWETSQHAVRAALHAYLNFKYFRSVSLELEPAIHVPKTLFHSGMVMYRFLKLSTSSGGGFVYTASDFEDSEFVLLPGLETPEACYDLLKNVNVSVVAGLVDVLRCLGHWGISRRMASILEALVDDLVVSLP